jgi:hypothetical protein
MRGLGIVVFVIAMLSYTACTTMPFSTGPRSIILNGKAYSETDTGAFVSWRCKDYFSDSSKLFKPTLFELGKFTNSKLSGSGFVLFDGGNSGEFTNYARAGINHRWNWGPNGAEFSFIIKPDGGGRFYDFSSVPLGERIKPDGIYKCY